MKLIPLLVILCGCLHVQPAQGITFKIATVSPDGLAWMKKLRQGMEDIAVKTEGRVEFKIYPGGVQGDDQTVLRKMRIGQLHGGAVAAGSLTRFYPDLQIYNLPLEFRNFEEVDYVRERLDSQIVEGLARNGIVSFGLTETGFAHIMSNQPVRSVEDLRSIKAWVPDNDPIALRLVRSYGVTPIPLNLADVLAALQTGLVDAVAVPPLVAIALQWHTQVKYVTDLPLLYIYSMLALDAKSFNRIDAADQRTVRDILQAVFKEVDEENRKGNINAYQALLNQGIKEVSPGPEERRLWLELATRSVDELVNSGEISATVLQSLNGFLEAIRQPGAYGSQ